MYRFTSTVTGKEVAVSDGVNYIKVSGNGSYVLTTEEEATGVAINSKPYNLHGHDIGCEDTVIITKFDGGAYVANQKMVMDNVLATLLEG